MSDILASGKLLGRIPAIRKTLQDARPILAELERVQSLRAEHDDNRNDPDELDEIEADNSERAAKLLQDLVALLTDTPKG